MVLVEQLIMEEINLMSKDDVILKALGLLQAKKINRCDRTATF
jgi:hypothetical protein